MTHSPDEPLLPRPQGAAPFVHLKIDETQDEADLRALIRDVLRDKATPDRIREFDENEKFDEDLYRTLADAGLIQLEADTEGNPPSHMSQTIVLEELGATATSMAVSLVVQYMGVTLLAQHGTAEQRKQYLVPLLSGRSRVAFALTEPGGGTDVARVMRTRATQESDGTWKLSGSKMWISGASDATFLLVLARTAPIERSAISGITMFIVPRSASGVTVNEMDTMAIHSLSTCEVGLSDVRVPHDAVLGEVNWGFRQVLATLNGERLNAAAVALGIARGAQDAALEYVRSREAFGRTIGSFQILQHRLVDGVVRLEGARSLLQRAARAADHGGAAETLSAMAKLAASEAATMITDHGMRAMGGSGLSREYSMQRFFRDARLYTFAPLTDEMIHNFIAEHHFKLPRSY
ncbi:acyl-CoA/acyl-ACP dehydrogenase [Intrasporangium calvum]|uniref:Acyl-CoA/acyl-ACP dehydrogenase n=1 Tax=Intrasporangium calvum TaxID=53358 RepID=A0ABT5GEK7_9MICO|nr:acyl-CoA dehydrogenase family protein [Intrasporangium calvum]MDC5696527.1 acyl-CoA/acyl-ACP dehydrogenase [Intrasporangium calvum]